MTKMLKLIQPLKISNEIYLPAGTIMDESTWCDFIGRKGGIDVTNSSDSEWWEEIIIEKRLRNPLHINKKLK